jgi:MFS family permease
VSLTNAFHSQGAWALGSVIGPIVGGAFAHDDLWRWVFYILLPFCGIGLVFIPLFIRIQRPEVTFKQAISRVDWIGGFLFISSATGFLIAVSWGGTSYAWDSWRTLVPLILGGLGLAATMVYERYGAKEPFLRHSLFHVSTAHFIYFGAFAQGLLVSLEARQSQLTGFR